MALIEIHTGLDRPLLATSDGRPGRIYVIEQTGRVLVTERESDDWQPPRLFLDLRSRIIGPDAELCWPGEFHAERGLLGLAFHPDFEANDKLYVSYTLNAPCGAEDRGALVISELQGASLGSGGDNRERIVMSTNKPLFKPGQPRSNHHGGMIAFGPDGLLYVGFGEGGHGGGRTARALDTRWGKLVRVDPTDTDGDGPLSFTIPADNPFVGDAAVLPEIWASGLRNPWRWSFDRLTGDIWIGDVGQFRYESVDRAPADLTGRNAARGLDFGWAGCEGAHLYDGSRPDDPEPGRCSTGHLPVLEYEHGGQSCAVTGGYVNRGPGHPSWQGAYVFADLCDGLIRAIDGDGNEVGRLATSLPITSFGEDEAGRIFVVGGNGALFELRFGV